MKQVEIQEQLKGQIKTKESALNSEINLPLAKEKLSSTEAKKKQESKSLVGPLSTIYFIAERLLCTIAIPVSYTHLTLPTICSV